MKKIVVLCLICLGYGAALASVTVVSNDKEYVFEYEPRLVEVIQPIANEANWYWPGAALYQANDLDLEKTRESLLDSLSSLIESISQTSADSATSLQLLQETISSWQLARRTPVKIDYDLARIDPAANPRLPAGEYVLNITQRKSTVQFFGAIHKPVVISHLGQADVSEYLKSITLLDQANKDIVVLIQADGRQLTVPVAYWNKSHQEVMPGSQVFVPLEESLFSSEISTINQQILTLASNRVL